VTIIDIHNCSVEPGGYMKKIKHYEMVQILRNTHPRRSWNRTLSKKGRGVKMLELKGNCRRRLIRFWTRFTAGAQGTQSEISPLENREMPIL